MFKITIEETKIAKEVRGHKWEQMDTKEVPRETCDPGDAKTRIAPVYGYTPEIEMSVEVKSTVLIQEVEVLDLAKVIKAINNL